jgi:hypothetical protein
MKIIIQKLSEILFGIFLIISVLMLISFQNKRIGQKPGNLTGTNGLVVLELFTSQGCSSCPPADALLAEYAVAHNEHIIPLSFHVDYWNRLGWADPFSNKAYSERQQWYSQHLPKGSVYTPQLIVNGRGEAVGNNRKIVNGFVQDELLVKKAETISVTDISFDKNMVSFHYSSANTNDHEILNIALVQKQAITHIKAGENEGVTITNHNIVRSFRTQVLSNEGAGSIALPAMFKSSEYALVLYVQNKNDLSISAATMKDLQ